MPRQNSTVLIRDLTPTDNEVLQRLRTLFRTESNARALVLTAHEFLQQEQHLDLIQTQLEVANGILRRLHDALSARRQADKVVLNIKRQLDRQFSFR